MFNIILTLAVIALFYSVVFLFARIVEKIREHKGKELNYYKLSKTNATLYGYTYVVEESAL